MDTVHTNIKNTRCQNGGRVRAKTAKRHPAYGIFLPDVMLWDNLFPSTYQHGRAGGLKRAQTGKKINGKYVKED